MTTIAAALQRPAPKPDREVAASPPEGDLPKLQGSDPQDGFGSVLRTVSGTETARRSGTAARDADEQDDAAGEGREAQTGAGAEPAPPVPAKPDTALLAAALNAALSTAVQVGDAGTGTDAPAAAPGGSVSAAQRLGAVVGAGAAALDTAALDTAALDIAAPGSAAGPGSAPGARVAAGNAEAAGVPSRRRDGSGAGGAPLIQVLDRTVHFKPVRPAVASSRSALAASTAASTAVDPASPQAGAKTAGTLTQPGAVDLSVPIAGRPRAAGIDGLPGATGHLEPDRAGLLDQLAAASPGGASRGRTEPESQTADGAARIAATGGRKADLTALADGRALSGIAEASSASADRRTRDGGSDTGTGGRSGTDLALPTATMPAIAAAITEEVQRAAANGLGLRQTADTGVKGTPDGPLRTLRIQLRPEELGTVTVELRLAEGRLETHLRAERPETAALLDRDSAILTDLLRQAHAQAEVTVGQARPAEAGSAAGDSRPQGQPAFADGGARPGSGGGGQRQAGQRAAAGIGDGERADETVRPRDGGVYL